jgi:hypothetical protein
MTAARKNGSSVLKILIESKFMHKDKDSMTFRGDSRISTSQWTSEKDLRSNLVGESDSVERIRLERVRDSRFVNASKAMKSPLGMATFCRDNDLIVHGNVSITVKRVTACIPKYSRHMFNLLR